MIEAVLLRPAEAAELLSMSRSRLYGMAQAGELPGVVRLGGSVRIHRPTLEAWLAEQAGMKGAAPRPNGTAQERRRDRRHPTTV
jgi:excisionase family DNA binding protein